MGYAACGAGCGGGDKLSKAELHIQMQLAEYLTLQYPGVIFRSDLGGIRLNMGQAVEAKKLQGGRRAYPDFFIACARHGYHGLFGEIKTSVDEVYTKAGGLRRDTHTQEQWRMLQRLCGEGYFAGWWCGFEDAKAIIDGYLAP